MSSGLVCNYLVILQAALHFYNELNVLAGESHQLTVAGSQSNILKEMQCIYLTLKTHMYVYNS